MSVETSSPVDSVEPYIKEEVADTLISEADLKQEILISEADLKQEIEKEDEPQCKLTYCLTSRDVIFFFFFLHNLFWENVFSRTSSSIQLLFYLQMKDTKEHSFYQFLFIHNFVI